MRQIYDDRIGEKKAAREILRNYLIRCHDSISANYDEIKDLPPKESADYLLHLKDSGRIEIELTNEANNLIGCKITDKQQSEPAI